MKFASNNNSLHQEFTSSTDKHILMITNHGTHQWNVIPGLLDTGGQNIFVNQFTKTLAELNYRITVVNRGGYGHPLTGDLLEGIDYLDKKRRIVYLRDNERNFIRKEDMADHIPPLADCLWSFLVDESQFPDLIISHYWDGAMLGIAINNRLEKKLKHVWVPHSLGAVKKKNMPQDTWRELKIDQRINLEKNIVENIDFAADTSSVIKESLKIDYNFNNTVFLPPCIDTSRYYKRPVFGDNGIWSFLSLHSGLSAESIKKCRIITEISRTDRTKRKDILIKAFSAVHWKFPDTFLIISIDKSTEKLYSELMELIEELGIGDFVAVIGNESERIPLIYSVTNIYCSPSIMEGFGMSVQEAASTHVPVVGSMLIPFVREYLIGIDGEVVRNETLDEGSVTRGPGAFMVKPDYVEGFTWSMERLLVEDDLFRRMAEAAYSITIPYFTWKDMTNSFLSKIGW